MEIVIIEKTAFEMLIAGVKALEDRVRTLAEKGGDRLAEQALRDRHGIAYSQIGRKFYYKPEDVERLLPIHAAEQPPV